MAAFGWLGPFRASLRRSALSLLRQLLATEEGRRILVESLPGGHVPAPPFVDVGTDRPERVYQDLGVSPPAAASTRAPIFITARFRTGSTLFWSLFRHVEGCTSYYEPLNERRWFDPEVRGDRIDRTHLGAEEYWREYEGLSHLTRFYRDRWIDRDLFMDGTVDDAALESYIQALIDAAPGRAVLQFNRVDFRLPWLRSRFPDARIVHLYRHPRDQWCSSLVDPAAVPRDIGVREFGPLDRFYLISWATDLSYVYPFLHPDRAEHPYDLFYLIWRLSYAFGRRYADASFGLEAFTTHPETELPRLLAACRVNADEVPLRGLIVPQPAGKWKAWADQDWFAAREARADALLASYFRRAPASAAAAI